MTRRELLASVAVLPAIVSKAAEPDWTPLFDGRTLDGWTASENKSSFRVVDGMIATGGPRSHLFYTGKFKNADFKNFAFKADVMARRECNSGVFFHTKYQDKGWPDLGFEVQVNNTATGEGTYLERKKTASLYGVRDIYKQFVKDGEWFRLYIEVRGKRVQIRMNDMLMVDYIEPDPPVREGVTTGRILDHGTFALQAHNQGSEAFFKNLMVAPLPDNLPTDGERPTVDQAYHEILALNAHNYPVVDYHVHIKGGLTLEDLVARSRRTGIGYGVAVNCGLNFPVTDDAGAEKFFDSLKGQPVFAAMQAEGREWVKMFSRKTFSKFDYVFTDAMTFTDDNGKRMRTWLPAEVGEIPDKQRFMETLVNRITGILNNEPVDIYANPTYVPDAIAKDYDELWTPVRMDRVIEAAKRNDVAMEINSRYNIPSAAFIKRAKAAGVKFSFGANNTDAGNLGLVDYGRAMVKECKLGWQDFFVPKPPGEKAAERQAKT